MDLHQAFVQIGNPRLFPLIAKIGRQELSSRVNEYIGYYISRHVGSGARRGVRVRPWTATELKSFAIQLQAERNLQAGVGNTAPNQLPDVEPE